MCSLDFFFRLFLLYQDKRNEQQAALAAKKECGTTVKVKTEKLATGSTEKERGSEEATERGRRNTEVRRLNMQARLRKPFFSVPSR
jgi:hypothetical protein